MKRPILLILVGNLCLLHFPTCTDRPQASASPVGQQSSDPGITASRALGVIVSVNPEAKQIALQTAQGASITVLTDSATRFYRMPPDETSMSKARQIDFAEIRPGDRAYARGRVAADLKSVSAQSVVALSRAEMEEKVKLEQEAWRSRGVTGIASQVSHTTQTITLQTPAGDGFRSLVIDGSGSSVRYRRYAPGSARFSESAPSSIAELKIGDVVHALGQKTTDGSRLIPEVIVFGTFRTIGGAITAIAPESNQIQLKDIVTNQPCSLEFNNGSSLKKLTPAATALLLAQIQQKRPKGDAEKSGAQDRPNILESLPDVSLAELKAGSVVIVSVSAGPADSMTAVLILAGAEEFFDTLRRRGQPIGSIPNLASMSF